MGREIVSPGEGLKEPGRIPTMFTNERSLQGVFLGDQSAVLGHELRFIGSVVACFWLKGSANLNPLLFAQGSQRWKIC